jgi:hypothetical protein
MEHKPRNTIGIQKDSRESDTAIVPEKLVKAGGGKGCTFNSSD